MTELQNDIMAVVKLCRLHPTELMASLRGYTDQEIKEACFELVNQGLLILSSDRYWEIPTPDIAESAGAWWGKGHARD